MEINDEKPIGSIKDVKYFCNYIYKKTLNKNHVLINKIMKICKKYVKR